MNALLESFVVIHLVYLDGHFESLSTAFGDNGSQVQFILSMNLLAHNIIVFWVVVL